MIYTREIIEKKKKSKEKMSRILRTIMYIVFVPITVYNILLIVQSVFNPYKTPSFLGIKNFVIISGSMEPDLQIGDIVVVKEIGKEKVKEGDIISFRCGQSIITHRVVEISQDDEEGEKQYVTKGDNNNTQDARSITKDLIEGRVTFVIPKLGKVAVVLQNKIMLLVVMLMFFLWYLNNSRKQEKRRRRKLKRLAMEAIKQEMEGIIVEESTKKKKENGQN